MKKGVLSLTGADKIGMSIARRGLLKSGADKIPILHVDLYAIAVLLEEVGKVIKNGGSGVSISSQSGHRMEALGAEKDALLTCMPCDKVLAIIHPD